MPSLVLGLALRHEPDVVTARQRARAIAEQLGFDAQDQTRLATAVSEIARNAYSYAGGGRVDFLVEGKEAPQLFVVQVSDQGPGIPNLSRVLEGDYESRTGMGLGIVGARRLVDRFEIESTPGRGTRVSLKKLFPRRAPVMLPEMLDALSRRLAIQESIDPLAELQRQNQELLRTLEELRARQEELSLLNSELEDTNRGVVALYAELDEKAEHLRQADTMKSRFLSNMSHEFRTPLNSILALSGLLLEHADGPLTSEQDKQVGFIRRAAEELSELVNDLLDLAKVEAGKIVVRPSEFDVAGLFGALRGMLRPLLVNEAVSLVIEDPSSLPPLDTDEAKVSQILRNFISNALKFTERGEVRVSATLSSDGQAVVFSVADTGIGIAPEDLERIFEDFTQLDHPVQRRFRGTGLGLPLTRKLTALLGGSIAVQSRPGLGSTFSATIPIRYAEPEPVEPPLEADWRPEPDRVPVLVVEDSSQERLLYEKFLKGTQFQLVHAATTRQARQALKVARPRAVILDIVLRGEDAWEFLVETKQGHEGESVPVIVATSVEDRQKGLALGADAYGVKPIERDWLIHTLTRLTLPAPERRLLIIDDEEADRYVLRTVLRDLPFVVAEAASGEEGLRRAREERPNAIILDLVMPGLTGFEVLDRLRDEPRTADIPVIVLTSKMLDAAEHRQLASRAAAVLSKGNSSRRAARAALREALVQAGIVVEAPRG
jgi:signal transduction histidine kinase/CheY-like chemotaxis protein